MQHQAPRLHLRGKSMRIKRRIYRIASQRMRQLQIQQVRRRNRMPRRTQRDPRIGVLAQLQPAIAHTAASNNGRSFNNRP